MLTATFGFFECPICIDLYLVPDWHTRKLPIVGPREYTLSWMRTNNPSSRSRNCHRPQHGD